MFDPPVILVALEDLFDQVDILSIVINAIVTAPKDARVNAHTYGSKQ